MSQFNIYSVAPISIQTPPVGYRAFFLDSSNNGFGSLMDNQRNIYRFSRDILSGGSDPSTLVGAVGDFYINTTSQKIFGPKSVSGWGVGTNLIGATGATGAQGPIGLTGNTGPQGPQGLQGAAGPVACTFVGVDSSDITMPDTTNYTGVKFFDATFPVAGRYLATCMVSISPHSSSNDVMFQWKLNNVNIGPEYVEEHKEISNNQKNIRGWQFDLGTQTAGTKFLDLYFKKESNGGTAIIKHVNIFVWRIS